jgi:hypothetical protein
MTELLCAGLSAIPLAVLWSFCSEIIRDVRLGRQGGS